MINAPAAAAVAFPVRRKRTLPIDHMTCTRGQMCVTSTKRSFVLHTYLVISLNAGGGLACTSEQKWNAIRSNHLSISKLLFIEQIWGLVLSCPANSFANRTRDLNLIFSLFWHIRI